MCNFFVEKSEVETNTEKCGKLRMEMNSKKRKKTRNGNEGF